MAACVAGHAAPSACTCCSAPVPIPLAGLPAPRAGGATTCWFEFGTFRGRAARLPRMLAMAVPSREAAARMLVELKAPVWLRDHSTAVAEVAAFLADRYRERGR